jgi:DNA-directed RNA polymerase specialized sigma24 family protein
MDEHAEDDVEIDLAADAAARAAVADLSRGDGSALEAAHRLREAADELITEFVLVARSEGATWAEIGEMLGVSTQAVHQKYRYATVDS